MSCLKEIDGLLVRPGKAYTQLTDHLITVLKASFGCHDVLILKKKSHKIEATS